MDPSRQKPVFVFGASTHPKTIGRFTFRKERSLDPANTYFMSSKVQLEPTAEKRPHPGHEGSPDPKRRRAVMARLLTPPEDLVTYYPDNPPDRWHENDQYLRNFNYA